MREQLSSIQEAEVRMFGETLESLKDRLSYDPRLLKAWVEIENGYASPTLTLEKAARLSGFGSGNGLNGRLKGYTPDTFCVLLTKFRLTRAVAILLDEDHSILNVALTVGVDQSTLDRNFKKYLHMSPREFRSGCRQAHGGRTL